MSLDNCFHGIPAWFSSSVSTELQKKWGAHGGVFTDSIDVAKYIFSSDATSDDTKRTFESLRGTGIVIFKPKWITYAIKVANKVQVGPLGIERFILFPDYISAELKLAELNRKDDDSLGDWNEFEVELAHRLAASSPQTLHKTQQALQSTLVETPTKDGEVPNKRKKCNTRVDALARQSPLPRSPLHSAPHSPALSVASVASSNCSVDCSVVLEDCHELAKKFKSARACLESTINNSVDFNVHEHTVPSVIEVNPCNTVRQQRESDGSDSECPSSQSADCIANLNCSFSEMSTDTREMKRPTKERENIPPAKKSKQENRRESKEAVALSGTQGEMVVDETEVNKILCTPVLTTVVNDAQRRKLPSTTVVNDAQGRKLPSTTVVKNVRGKLRSENKSLPKPFNVDTFSISNSAMSGKRVTKMISVGESVGERQPSKQEENDKKSYPLRSRHGGENGGEVQVAVPQSESKKRKLYRKSSTSILEAPADDVTAGDAFTTPHSSRRRSAEEQLSPTDIYNILNSHDGKDVLLCGKRPCIPNSERRRIDMTPSRTARNENIQKSCAETMQKHKEMMEIKKAGQKPVEDFTYGSFSGFVHLDDLTIPNARMQDFIINQNGCRVELVRRS